MSSNWLGTDKYQFYKSLVWLNRELNSWSPTREPCALLIRPPRPVAEWGTCSIRVLWTCGAVLIRPGPAARPSPPCHAQLWDPREQVGNGRYRGRCQVGELTAHLKLHSPMTFESLHYFEIDLYIKKTVVTHYSLIWINVDVKWLRLEQFELKEP